MQISKQQILNTLQVRLKNQKKFQSDMTSRQENDLINFQQRQANDILQAQNAIDMTQAEIDLINQQ